MTAPVNASRPARVCVVIPAYNRAAVVCEAVESVLAQRYQDLTIMIVDDGSTDDTRQVVAERFGRQPLVRYLHKENTGPGPSRNLAIRNVGAELIAFLDSDDLWTPDKLETQVRHLDANPEVGLSFTDAVIQGEDTTLFRWHRFAGDTTMRGILEANFPIHTSSVLIRRSVIDAVGWFDESFLCREDTDLWMRVIAAHPVVCLDGRLTIVRRQSDSMSLTRDREIWRSAVRLWNKNRELLLRSGCPRGLVRNRVARAHRKLARLAHSLGDYHEARTHYLRSWRCHPYRPRGLLWWAALSMTLQKEPKDQDAGL